jgi:hypothetical protein
MGTRQTSIDCYNQIKSEGLLSKRRLEVYEALLNSAPCTSAEALVNVLDSNNVLSQSRARFTELRDLRVIYEKGVKKCSVTNRIAIEWDLTDNIPVSFISKTKTLKQKVKELSFMVNELNKKTSDLFVKSELSTIEDYIKENFKI